MGKRAGQLTPVIKHLGADKPIWGKLFGKPGKTLTQRWNKRKGKRKKLKSLQRAGARQVGKVYVTGTLPALTYASEIYGLPDRWVNSIRTQRLKLDGDWQLAVPTDAQYALQPVRNDPGLNLAWQPLKRYLREVWMLANRGVWGS